jgi:hypothetical protein
VDDDQQRRSAAEAEARQGMGDALGTVRDDGPGSFNPEGHLDSPQFEIQPNPGALASVQDQGSATFESEGNLAAPQFQSDAGSTRSMAAARLAGEQAAHNSGAGSAGAGQTQETSAGQQAGQEPPPERSE